MEDGKNVQQLMYVNMTRAQYSTDTKRDVDPLINEIKKIIYCLRVLRLFSRFSFHPMNRQQYQHQHQQRQQQQRTQNVIKPRKTP